MDRRRIALDAIARASGRPLDDLAPEVELVAHLGIDSPKALSLLVDLEDRLGIEIDDDRIVELHTVGDVLAAVESEASGASGRSTRSG